MKFGEFLPVNATLGKEDDGVCALVTVTAW
jgi:hypothetical protein